MGIEEDKIPPEYLELIGKIAIYHSKLEFGLIWSIATFTNRRYSDTLCLVAGENFDVLETKLTRVFHRLVNENENDIKEFETMKSLITDANNKRNHYLHGYWFIEETGKISSWKFSKRFTTKLKGIRDNTNTISLEELQQAVIEIDSTITHLAIFVNKFSAKYENIIQKAEQKKLND